MGDLLAFDVVRTGYGQAAGVQVVPRPSTDGKHRLPLNTVPMGTPPVLPSPEETIEQYLLHPEKLPIHDYTKLQKFWLKKGDPSSLLSAGMTPAQSNLAVDRDPRTGELTGFKEVMVEGLGSSAKNSLSLLRAPDTTCQSVTGSSTNYPFWPGGLEEASMEELKQAASGGRNVDLDNDLLTVPPSFERGMTFEDRKLSELLQVKSTPGVLRLNEMLSDIDDLNLSEEDEEEMNKEAKSVTCSANQMQEVELDAEQKKQVEEIIQLETRTEQPGEEGSMTDKPREEFAVVLDVKKPVKDFHKRIPNMAYKWPFELDTFQKQAILCLENHDSVFVAAHTSAGKTVVAEYAIALSMQHMTRTIYTSPIKALSNQKFRDFKQTFKDVGLITGDVQIAPEAACLIMTTEILRSMLYNGADTIRDLECVIFDEVHYINDAERGVVWEEVLIMLPQHVSIILLSATVPNCREFADWVGRIKQRKVYVVSTPKRPVPLEHYLYTGNSSKTSNQLFLLLDAEKNFLTAGYNQAFNAKQERTSKSSQSFGAKGPRSGSGGPQQERNIWLSIIDMLRKKDKLPVVAFTFSKRRINENAEHLRTLDLLTAKEEKSEVHIFFQKSVGRLKGSDRNLPQVVHMRELLKRGIGIHHSGILPILKEVVEMLFQKGLVKILFATETFAMGVNMPARTVVFDNTRKHDGTKFRDLLPGEYIQMAGRAGRRGLDTTGTVIQLCKDQVPEMAELHKMMLGKPTQLASQFRLTYTMMLNLLRVEQLRVEDMIKRSFSEFHTQKDAGKKREKLEELSVAVKDLPEVVDWCGDLEQYYEAWKEHRELKTRLQGVVQSHPAAIKSLTPGRIVVISNDHHKNAVAFILKAASALSKDRTYTALVLCEQPAPGGDLEADAPRSTEACAAVNRQLFRPEGVCGHKVMVLVPDHIEYISTKTGKINAERIMDDVKKRQMPRFRNEPPGQSVVTATQELLRLVEGNPEGLPSLDPVKDLHIRDIDLVEEFRRLKFLEEGFSKFICIHQPNFEANFRQVHSNNTLRSDYNKLLYQLSDESLALLPEYQQRIQVLQRLNYIDTSNLVQLKGRVACEMSNQELIVTELVFENALTSLPPEEIAALLSCVVFEQKRCSDPELTPNMEKARNEFIRLATGIGEMQKECGLPIPPDDYVEQFHFGLMQVVYEWAKSTEFSEITKLTDVEEGIIVRCIQRLDEVLKDVRNAARIIGDPILKQKMEDASRMIKRDIVFAASLYTQ